MKNVLNVPTATSSNHQKLCVQCGTSSKPALVDSFFKHYFKYALTVIDLATRNAESFETKIIASLVLP